MTVNVFVGLPVTSHTNNALCTATFTNVTVSTGASGIPPSPFNTPVVGSTHSLSVFPNPLQGDILYIEATIPSTSNVSIQIISLQGQVMFEKEMGELEAGTATYQVDMSAFPKRTYIVRVLSAKGNHSAFVIKR
jgi:hypothetical protein